jgi:hypothetical protein
MRRTGITCMSISVSADHPNTGSASERALFLPQPNDTSVPLEQLGDFNLPIEQHDFERVVDRPLCFIPYGTVGRSGVPAGR